MKKFWKLTNAVEGSGSTLVLEGPVASETWWGDEITPQLFRDELKKVSGNELTVVINSVGGDVWAGVSIYDALKELDANITVKVSGLAASIASVIAMAGDRIVMTPGSTMMVHRASSLAFGNAEDLEKTIEMLETVEDGIISIYAERTGNTREYIQELMDAETWMSAEKAVELGFADEVKQPEKKAESQPDSMFSGKFAFSMSATKESLKNFADKVAKNEGENNVDSPIPEAPVPDEAADEQGREEETSVETTEVEEETINEENIVEKETPKETPVKEAPVPEQIAQDQVLPEVQAKVTPSTVNSKDYINSRKSMEDYAHILAKHAGEQPADVKNAWQSHLAKMGITNPEVLLPAAVVTAIEDAFKEGGEIWNLVNKTGLDVYKVMWDTVTGEDSRAKGYNRADNADKAEEVITLDERTLRPQFIYKYLTIPKEVVRENRSSGALLQYVLSELPRRIVREVERAIVIGDGRADGTDYKITSFVSLKEDAADGNAFADVYTPVTGEDRYADLLRARGRVKAAGAKYLVAKSDYLTDVQLLANVNGGLLFPPGTNVGSAMGFAGVITPDWLDDTSDPDNDAYIFVPSQYRTVGDNTIESFSNFVLKQNLNEYLQEIWAGGGLTARDSAIAIATRDES